MVIGDDAMFSPVGFHHMAHKHFSTLWFLAFLTGPAHGFQTTRSSKCSEKWLILSGRRKIGNMDLSSKSVLAPPAKPQAPLKQELVADPTAPGLKEGAALSSLPSFNSSDVKIFEVDPTTPYEGPTPPGGEVQGVVASIEIEDYGIIVEV
jgi:hypothetical protein